ncbi:thioredoxin-like [Rhinatrema bivittatum]|uniref:thioredoxin-like n=1 Tax=Rhinatrema bivittatum TaxID=194408 RepID=UPI0011293079|nr:thioredoxin-like [Rhinatrema bivittatum]XP_029470970.1 thioredoxin-like [Rhinatrema bivittatum]
MVKEIQSKGEFDQILIESSDKLVVTDFSASWCGPCKKIAPYYEALCKQYKDVVFLKVDVDEVADLAEAWEISSMPTFMFFKKGKKVAVIKGAYAEDLKAKIEELKC